MTLEQKNFLLGFLAISGVNKDVRDFEMNVREQVSEIIDLLPKEEISKGIRLESNLLELLELIKWSYFDYGISANETDEEWDLTWTPDIPNVAERITKEVKKEKVA